MWTKEICHQFSDTGSLSLLLDDEYAVTAVLVSFIVVMTTLQ